ncbi:hypothetical protein ElyMa_003796700 [Elysia marginata]|uniref:Uncharacterized protein n=1 Tax=Elysia marginata TaxID=1093978 RepID=A0AAV4FBR5_9GAST|nr:hypothetical protein ElyMa_003796700 [Elysia marginata]
MMLNIGKHNKSIWLPLSRLLGQVEAPSVAYNAARRHIKQKPGQAGIELKNCWRKKWKPFRTKGCLCGGRGEEVKAKKMDGECALHCLCIGRSHLT